MIREEELLISNWLDEKLLIIDLLLELFGQYDLVRLLPDGSIAAASKLAFTTGIFLGLNRTGWQRRFCFEDHGLALQRFAELRSEDDEPAGYIATRSG